MQVEKVGVSTKALIFRDDKFLTLLRGETAPSNPLKWDLPGGVVDEGEDPDESILREVYEETGLQVSNLVIIDVESHLYKDEHWLTICYKAEPGEGPVKISWEHDEYRWVDKPEYLKLPNIPKIVKFVEKVCR